MQERLIRIEELIELLGEKSKQAVYNKINRKKLLVPTYKIGRSLRWKLSEVNEFIDKIPSID
jgi:predicted DNA-binding transcriptional regulator AlpA